MTDLSVVPDVEAKPAFEADMISDALVAKLEPAIANAKRAKAALAVNPGEYLVTLREQSTDPAVVKIRDQVEALLAKADEILKPLLDENRMSEDDAKVMLAESRKTVKNLVEAGDSLRPGFQEYIATVNPDVESIIRSRATSTGTSGQVGIGRPRVIAVNVDGKDYDTFSLAAKAIGAAVPEMHTKWQDAAGKRSKDITEGTVTEFDFNVGDNVHKVIVRK